MSDTALSALYRAVRQRLTATPELWEGRVYADFAPAGTPKPYLLFFFAGGGEMNTVRARDAALLLNVKVVADSFALASQGAARIDALLNDSGVYDSASPLAGGTDWHILTVTGGLHLHVVEPVDGRQVFHEGGQYRVVMETV